jgi:SAM-dependent methyltransferase
MTAYRDDHALRAYEGLAPVYDELTADHEYGPWTATIEGAARKAGLRGRRMLDVACGTGKSFMPFLERGYDVCACDLSPAMVERARAKAGGRARVEVHDMRDLPVLGAFDLICCLDDAVNYLTADGELEAALAGMAANLGRGGVLAFDANTLHSLRTAFAELRVLVRDDRVFVWEGQGSRETEAGGLARARIEVLEASGAAWTRTATTHCERHLPEGRVREAIAAAGLDCVAVHGFTPDGRLWATADDERHSKALYIARASAPDTGEGR